MNDFASTLDSQKTNILRRGEARRVKKKKRTMDIMSCLKVFKIQNQSALLKEAKSTYQVKLLH